ncbi:MAG TPA: hypothetical protein VHT75_18545 [Acidimicrobiales bacterium]|nr:hypothetical protein [Acidimicrobiales bacterium]
MTYPGLVAAAPSLLSGAGPIRRSVWGVADVDLIMRTDLQQLGGPLVGRWIAEATHPAFPGTVISGSSDVEWLEGEQFLIQRSHYDHPDFPDTISVIGDTDGLHLHYFDSRGVYRIYEVTVAADGWTVAMARKAPPGAFASSDPHFAQRVTYRFRDADQEIAGKAQLSYDDVNWNDDLEVTYRRA